MIHDVGQRGKTPIVEETSLLVTPKSRQRGCSIHMSGRPVCLERIYADFFGRVQVVSRLGKQRGNVAGCALRLSRKQGSAALRSFFVKRAFGRFRRGNCELIEM